jgi:hypothetical protein
MEAEACGGLRRTEHLTSGQKSPVHRRSEPFRTWYYASFQRFPSGLERACSIAVTANTEEPTSSLSCRYSMPRHCIGERPGAVTPSLALVMPVSRCSPVRATSAHVHAGPFAGGSRATIRSLRSPTFAPQWLVRDLLPLPPTGGIPRETTRSLSPPSSAALRA